MSKRKIYSIIAHLGDLDDLCRVHYYPVLILVKENFTNIQCQHSVMIND